MYTEKTKHEKCLIFLFISAQETFRLPKQLHFCTLIIEAYKIKMSIELYLRQI